MESRRIRSNLKFYQVRMLIKQTSIVIALSLGLAAGIAFAGQVPRKSPGLTINIVNGKPLKLDQFRGKIVALAFISTTCPHCQKLTQVMNGIQKEYGPRGVQVLEAAVNPQAPGLLPEFQRQFQPVFPVGYVDRMPALGYLELSVLTPFYVPDMVFLDRSGMIRAQHLGQDEFFRDMEKNIRLALDGLLNADPVSSKHATRHSRRK